MNGAAEYLSLSRWTIYKLVRDGELRAFRVGKRLRLRVADLDTYAERGSP
ncbi:MAG: excisionase family DNA-binding protein [Actinomycetota bacterium]|nr:excisionase family DNA-binding protein [Actinomycetota bacterium]